MSANPDGITARDMKANDLSPRGVYFVHRHEAEERHTTARDCWCAPLTLWGWQIQLLDTAVLQATLDEHFRVH